MVPRTTGCGDNEGVDADEFEFVNHSLDVKWLVQWLVIH